MLKRTVTAVVLIAYGIFAVGVPDSWWIYTATTVLVAGVGTYEMTRVAELFHVKYVGITIPLIAAAAAMPFCARWCAEQYGGGEGKLYFFALLGAVYGLLLFFTLAFAVASKEPNLIGDFAVAYAGSFYSAIAASSLALLNMGDFGRYNTFMVLLLAIVPDTAAYLIGSKFGRHKLIPAVSPKKSVEGFIAGLAGGVIGMLLYGLIVRFVFKVNVHFIQLAALALVLTAVGVMGDLIASVIKRKYGAKDYSNIFPGHGGVYDRFDATFAVAIFTYLLTVGTGLITVFS